MDDREKFSIALPFQLPDINEADTEAAGGNDSVAVCTDNPNLNTGVGTNAFAGGDVDGEAAGNAVDTGITGAAETAAVAAQKNIGISKTIGIQEGVTAGSDGTHGTANAVGETNHPTSNVSSSAADASSFKDDTSRTGEMDLAGQKDKETDGSKSLNSPLLRETEDPKFIAGPPLTPVDHSKVPAIPSFALGGVLSTAVDPALHQSRSGRTGVGVNKIVNADPIVLSLGMLQNGIDPHVTYADVGASGTVHEHDQRTIRN